MVISTVRQVSILQSSLNISCTYDVLVRLDMSDSFQGLMASDEKLGKSMLFPLAERMVVKFVNESKIDAEAGKHTSLC